jgi:hypothetical protein
VIHIERLALPDGLRALAHRDERGNLVIYVSETLDPASQRAAATKAVRALRRPRWQAGLPPAGIALFLALRAWAGRAGRVIRAHPAAWGSAAVTAVAGAAAAGLFLVPASHPNSPAASGGGPGHTPSAAVPSQPAQHPLPTAHPPLSASTQPVPAALISPGPRQTGPAGQPGPVPASTSPSEPASATSPATPGAPSPAPSAPAGSATCIRLLGIHLCLRL